jgi:predicted transcriptional regulator
MTLREWLKKVRLSITSFSQLIKVDRSYIHSWMKGRKVPSKWIMERVKEVSMDQVIQLQDKEMCDGKKEKES